MTAPSETPKISRVLIICSAYESGYGKGAQGSKSPNPYRENSEEREAYDLGYSTGRAEGERYAAQEKLIGELAEALKTANQALLEFRHAYDAGPGWYTRGEVGLRSQVDRWLRKGLSATTAALSKLGDGK